MTRAELIANAEELIVTAGRNLNQATAFLQASQGRLLATDCIDLTNAQSRLATACIDLARLK